MGVGLVCLPFCLVVRNAFRYKNKSVVQLVPPTWRAADRIISWIKTVVFSLGNAVFRCAPLPPPSWGFALRVMLSLAVPEHAYTYHMSGSKGLSGSLHRGVSTHHLPENTTVEFSHFVGVHYTWKICLPPASPWQTGVTLCDPVFIWTRHRRTGGLRRTFQSLWADLALRATTLEAWWAGWNITHLRYRC